jgi:Fic family protein
MTNREFYLSVINGTVSEETINKASELLAALDTRNEKRKSTESKEKKEAAARRDAVLAFLKEQTEPVTRDTIAGVLDMTPAQASAACKSLGDMVMKVEIKVDKARKVAYSIA